mgnify:FL=1
MIESLAIALWSHLFCGVWSSPSNVFGWLKSWAFNTLPEWAFKPFIGCGVCHSAWIAGGFQIWHVTHGAAFGFGNALVILGASFMAWLLEDFAELRDKWKNA